MKITPAHRLKIASDRVKIERDQLTAMSTRIKLKSESSVHIRAEVMRIVCDVFGVTEEAVKGKCRLREIAITRHAYCHLCSSLDPMGTLVSIAETINRDHSTIIHSIKKCNDLRETDFTFAAMFQECIMKLSESTEKEMVRLNFTPEQISRNYSKRQRQLQKTMDASGIVHQFMNIWDTKVLSQGFSIKNKDVVAAFNDLRVEATRMGF
jgi:hypothetical protein